MPSVLDVFSRQLLCRKSDIVGNDEIVESCDVIIKDVKIILSRRRARSWTLLAGLILMQTFPAHVMHFARNIVEEEASF